MSTALTWIENNIENIILVAVVLIGAIIITKILRRVIITALGKAGVPNASIFINIMRVLIWFVALTTILQPIFGITPTSLITALGVGGIAVSLGLQDTISNVISGFELMLGKVIQPGDMVRISGTTGVVKDITWRQTVILERGGNEMVIPNSVLNTSSLERLTPASEGCVTVEFTVAAGSNLAQVEKQVIKTVNKATDGMRQNAPTTVKFTGFTPYGISGQVQVFTKFDVQPSVAADVTARALAGADFIEQRAAVGA